MGDAASSCMGEAPPPPPLPVLVEAAPRIHVAVSIGRTGCELLVAAAALHAFEIHDATMIAEDEGEQFDPRTDTLAGIFGSFGILRRSDDSARPYWLCGTPHPDFSEEDICRAVQRMGHFGKCIEAIYSVEEPLRQTECLNVSDVALYADEIGARLPRDVRLRMNSLVHKHTPRPVRPKNVGAEMRRLERASREFTRLYESSRKRRRTQLPARASGLSA